MSLLVVGLSHRTAPVSLLERASVGADVLEQAERDLAELSGLEGGDDVTVTVTIDDRPKTVEVPQDLQAALDAVVEARAFFDGLSRSVRKHIVSQVTAAKAPETRARRIASYVDKFADGKSR